jgi:N-carbamoylputrescine amidase
VTQLTIALLQMVSNGTDQEANLAKGEAFCRRAAMMGADIALFPEMWNIGYTFFDRAQPGAVEAWASQAVGAGDRFVTHFRSLARELKMAIALTYLEKWPGGPRNSVSLIDRHGEIVMTYAKVHTCDFDVECALTPGDDFYVCELDTAAGPVKIGAMICYDREFPESARVLMLKGAEIILTPNSCPMEANRLGQLRARAYENMVGVALANYAAPEINGHSVAYDPMGFAGEDGPSRDTVVIEAGENEDIYLARFDLDMLREYRQRETWGNAFRKPRTYSILTSMDVEPPFVRGQDRR